ncbi:hypothetical protein LTR62_007324 [Meristemomyces frigidus]|uniref:Zn(2)-C6 fungal-type domain-containing protein n=1 Tax=Meristemomyces frigidus TaxID=1508187 RepID=A0AAN7TMB4_9PEZI|nr:hypothetical protein LTR62_007324 [Meristemomyces frigidus]
MDHRAPRIGHKKSRKGCAQCKRRHVKCDEQSPCANCVRHAVPCSLAGGPNVPREDAKQRRPSATSSSGISRTASHETNQGASSTRTTSFDATENEGVQTPQAIMIPNVQRSPPTQRRSPFTVLTGLIDRPVPGEDPNWMLDLQLMHHYLNHTKYIITETSAEMAQIVQIWQEELPKVAFSADYCMHALLGFAALHRAHIEPEMAPLLRTSAVDHLDKALVRYRECGAITTAENASAKFAFTWLVVLFAYAVPPSVPPIDAMVELFHLVKGVDTILAESWFWVSQGPFAPVLARGLGEAMAGRRTSLPEGMDFGLNHLDYMLGSEPMLSADRRCCGMILAELKQLYDNVVRPQPGLSVASILCFPKQDSAPFGQLIKRRVPQALIILAYYCVILDILDTRWWISGWSARVLRDIMATLPESLQNWIEWPVSSVLLKSEQAAESPAERLGLLV